MIHRLFDPKRLAFTLIEVMIVLAVLAVLTGVMVGFAVTVRKTSQDMVCLHNLRQISTGLLMFQQEHDRIPLTDPPLAETLAPYLNEPAVFMCPATRYPTADSYSKYYVPRPPNQPGGFLLGCANHGDTGIIPSGFGAGKALEGKVVPVVWNGQPVRMGDEVVGGTLKFIDGTEVAVDPDLKVVVLTSFSEDGGKTYSAIRIPKGAIGAIQVNAAHGTRFDIVSPACTAGVRGTKFRLYAYETPKAYHTSIAVQEGVVGVDSFWPELRQVALSADQYGDYEYPKEPTLSILGPTFTGKYIFYKLTNATDKTLQFADLTLTWPLTNKNVMECRLDSTVVFNLKTGDSPLHIVSSWVGSLSLRDFEAGATKTLAVKFETNAATSTDSYALDVGSEVANQ
jgi:prepilin-type N-terminal cleavage/methylation domain-containing protein